MDTGLIEMDDGVLVEVELDDAPRNISATQAARVSKDFEQIAPLLRKVCKPIASVWAELNRDLAVEEVEIALGLSLEGEGNFFITKATAKANLTVKLKLKAKPE